MDPSSETYFTPEYLPKNLLEQLQTPDFAAKFNETLLNLAANLYGYKVLGFQEIWEYSNGYLARRIVRFPGIGKFTGSELCYEATTLAYFGMNHLMNTKAIPHLDLDFLYLHVDFDAINLGIPYYKESYKPHVVLLVNSETVIDFTNMQLDPKSKKPVRIFNFNKPPSSFRIAPGMVMLINESQLYNYERHLAEYAQPVSDVQLLFESLVS